MLPAPNIEKFVPPTPLRSVRTGTDQFVQEDDTATAILKKKKKPNQLMYVEPAKGGRKILMKFQTNGEQGDRCYQR